MNIQPAVLNLPRISKLKTLLILGRVSNLPTVWSNCVAGWWLAGGGGTRPALISMIGGITLLYIGGMFLNDAFDASFDRSYRNSRPIPSGAITEREVWWWSFLWIIGGFAALAWLGKTAAALAFCLVLCIMFYNAVHKVLAPVGVVLMGMCRVFVYLTAASVAENGVSGEPVWKGIALGIYVIGVSCLARKESTHVKIQYWPCVFLTAPLVFAALFDNTTDDETRAAWICGVVFAVWVGWTLWQSSGRAHPNIGRAIGRLLAGIALLDLLAVASWSHFAWVFPALFLVALFLQRFIPAS